MRALPRRDVVERGAAHGSGDIPEILQRATAKRNAVDATLAALLLGIRVAVEGVRGL